MGKTKIAWTDVVFNPVTGCTKVSAGCANCYAESTAKRFWGKRKFSDVQCHPDRLDQPLHWRKPRRIFVCSMGDLFHEAVPFSFVDKVFSVMALTLQHTYQVLTKRPKRMLEYFAGWDKPDAELDGEANAEWLLGFLGHDKWRDKINSVSDYFRSVPSARPNLWLGVSVENQETADERIPLLLRTPAAKKFVSYEPALGPIDFRKVPGFNTVGLDLSNWWIICGGESGPNARPCDIKWVHGIVRQCREAEVPVFVKQIHVGGRFSKNPNEWPENLRIREFPLNHNCSSKF